MRARQRCSLRVLHMSWSVSSPAWGKSMIVLSRTGTTTSQIPAESRECSRGEKGRVLTSGPNTIQNQRQAALVNTYLWFQSRFLHSSCLLSLANNMVVVLIGLFPTIVNVVSVSVPMNSKEEPFGDLHSPLWHGCHNHSMYTNTAGL